MRRLGVVILVGLAASACYGDVTPINLAPIGNPHFSSSITQSAVALPSSGSYYVGLRVTNPQDAFIESVSQLGGIAAGTDRYTILSSGTELVEAWYVNLPSPTFAVTFEVASILGSVNQEDYVGLQFEGALAGVDGTINASRQWLFTDGQAPVDLGYSGIWSASYAGGEATGWYVTDLSLDGSQWHGGTVLTSLTPIPAPGAALLGCVGLSVVAWFRRKLA